MRRKKTPHKPTPTPQATVKSPGLPRHRRNFARWRTLSLSLVYVIFAIHIVHWKVTGRTLAPLELNEVMYTLELGIITAGFLFMCFLVLGTLIFGRFFCSWACHIMVLQDLCAWLLRRLGIRQKPIRSRLLLYVPPLTAFYMFIWPQVLRAWQCRAVPTFHFRTDAEGWASFVTNNFWRNLPSPPIIVFTFLVCGVFIVYLLGSRTFCTYVCPYGAIFSLADRFAPGRISVNDSCRQCGSCTAACTSGVRVHEEVRLHGKIVNPACLKDLDCISVCPENALRYTFTRPSLWGSIKSGGRFGRQPYDFSLAEELLMAAVFLFTLLALRGLYSRIPFLLSLACGAITGYATVVSVRLMRRPSVSLSNWCLKDVGCLTKAGQIYVAIASVLAILIGHSAFVRYHEFLGLTQAIATPQAAAQDRNGLATSALHHLSMADRWGLLRNPRVEHSLVDVSFQLRRFDDAEKYAVRLLAREPDDDMIRLRLAQVLADRGQTQTAEHEIRTIIERLADARPVPPALAPARRAMGTLLAGQGRFDAADVELQESLRLDPLSPEVLAESGSVLAELGHFNGAIERLREAIRLDPSLAQAHYNLGAILARNGQFDDAIPCYERTLGAGWEDSDVHNNLGYALMRTERATAARAHFEQAILLNPDNANAHYNLGTFYRAAKNEPMAVEQFRLAARLDPHIAKVLSE